MEPNTILTADLLDIIFEGKNNAYGAYQLRKSYNNRLLRAVSAMALICILFFITQLFASDQQPSTASMFVKDLTLAEVDVPEKKIAPKLPEPKPLQQPKVATTKVTAIEIVNDLLAKEPLPTVEEINNTRVGLITQEGSPDELTAPPLEVHGTGNINSITKEQQDYEGVFTKVEKEAQFPGGPDGWRRYLERNIDANIAADEGAPVGQYTVRVQFIVDKTGNISDIKAIEIPKHCPGCEAEAIRVIKRGPRWEPAIQNGRAVIFQAVQVITFQVAE